MRLEIDTYNREAGAPSARFPRRGRSSRICAGVCLSVALAIAGVGCGGGGGASTAAAKSRAIAFTSPSIANGSTPGRVQTIPVRYTCDGANTTPSFRWGAVPPNTAELALFLFRIARSVSVAGHSANAEVAVEWAVAGLSPSLHAISAGKLPDGAVAARRYSICPAKGSTGTYIFELNAVSRRLRVRPRFDATALFREAEGSTLGSGTFASVYKRA